MRLQNVPLDQIDWNPWRDKSLNPIDNDHVRGLLESIKDHGFFASVKGRRVSGRVQIGCGHQRLEAARKARLESIPVYIDDIDDDAMLRLMTDENALQSGGHAGATMNEVAAVIRRLVEVVSEGEAWTNVHASVRSAFEDRAAFETAKTKLNRRLTNSDASVPIGINTIQNYFGDNSHRPERQTREAIAALKQSGRYDEIIDEAIRKHARPVANAPEPTSRGVTRTRERQPPRRVLDERTATLFPNDHQFHAFRDAVTTPGAQKVIPVNKQYALAKDIMSVEPSEEWEGLKGATSKKQIGAPYIKKMVHVAVKEGMDKQREIDRDEREAYLAEQREQRIDAELSTAGASLRSLTSSITKLIELADEYPHHPKIGGFSAKLDSLVNSIKQLSQKLR